MKRLISSWFGSKPRRPDTRSDFSGAAMPIPGRLPASTMPPVPAPLPEALRPTRFGMAVHETTGRHPVVWFPDPGGRPDCIVVGSGRG